jgi:predicted  nucleic acid-binding Zn-ribbon protein
MSTIAKVFTVLNLVFALFLLGANASMLSNLEDWRKKHEHEKAEHAKDNADKQAQIEAAIGDRDKFDSENKTLRNQKHDLESELQTARSQAESLRNDNNQLRNAIDAINESLKQVKAELTDVQTRNKALMDQNEQYRATAAAAEKDKLDAQDDRARIEGDLKRANEDLAEKERQLEQLVKERDNLRAEMEALVAAGIPVHEIIGNNVPAIEGKVSMVGPGFVVLSVGENEGVKKGYPFDVYRGGDYIGRVVVDKVLPDTCTARVQMLNKQGLAFQAMDNATTRL